MSADEHIRLAEECLAKADLAKYGTQANDYATRASAHALLALVIIEDAR